MKITLIGNKSGVYIDPRNSNAYVDYAEAVNFTRVNFEGVNHLVIRRKDDGELTIVQAGGYNSERGIFTDLYS